MRQVIQYTNAIGDSLVISVEKPFLLKSIEGLSGSTMNNISYKSVYQDGEFYKSSNLKIREIIIKFTILAADSKDLMEQRNKITNIFNPKLGEGKLLYSYGDIEREIICISDGSPFMPIEGQKKDCTGEIVLLGYNPYLTDRFKQSPIISTWIGGWKFKFKLPFRFKQRGETKKNIYNEGHVETPVEIIFKGPAVNPKIMCRSCEFIKVDRELTADDILYITTEFGNKKVEIERNGVRQNAFHYIDLDSTFFQLKVGDNMIEYSTDNDLDPQSVEIRYRNKYLGV